MPQETSVLNILPATVEDLADDGPGQVLVGLRLGTAEHSTRLLSRISLLSARKLGIGTGDVCFRPNQRRGDGALVVSREGFKRLNTDIVCCLKIKVSGALLLTHPPNGEGSPGNFPRNSEKQLQSGQVICNEQ